MGFAAFGRQHFPTALNALLFCMNDVHSVGVYVLFFTRNKFHFIKVKNYRGNLLTTTTT